MISSSRLRQSINITVQDIFSDFNDPRKPTFVKRVEVAIEQLERRMKNEVQSNNLSNLQLLLKKQHNYKQLQQKYQLCLQEKDEKQLSLIYYQNRIKQIQNERQKMMSDMKFKDQKVKNLIESVNLLQGDRKAKDKQLQEIKNELQQSIKENQRLQMQRQHLTKIIFNLKINYNNQLDDFRFKFKIQSNKLLQNYHQNLQTIITKTSAQKDKKSLQQFKHTRHHKVNKVETKNQKIQASPSSYPSQDNIKLQSARSLQRQELKNGYNLIEQGKKTTPLKNFSHQQVSMTLPLQTFPQNTKTSQFKHLNSNSTQTEQQNIENTPIAKVDESCQIQFLLSNRQEEIILQSKQAKQANKTQRYEYAHEGQIQICPYLNNNSAQGDKMHAGSDPQTSELQYWKERYRQQKISSDINYKQLQQKYNKRVPLQQHNKQIKYLKIQIGHLQLQIQRMMMLFKKQRSILMQFSKNLLSTQPGDGKYADMALQPQKPQRKHSVYLRPRSDHCYTEPQKEGRKRAFGEQADVDSWMGWNNEQSEELITILKSKQLLRYKQRRNSRNSINSKLMRQDVKNSIGLKRQYKRYSFIKNK